MSTTLPVDRTNCWPETGLIHEIYHRAELRARGPSDPHSGARSYAELAKAAGPTVTAEGIGARAALELFEQVLLPATRAQGDPLNLAYIPAAPTPAAVAFDALTSAANVLGGIWEAGAGAIWAEDQALGWIRELLEWPDTAAGTFVSGGTMGNLSALFAARTAATARLAPGPSRPLGGWRLACAPGAHASVALAAKVLDVELLEIPDDGTGHLDTVALSRMLKDQPSIFAVVASAGTTNAGIIDDLATIAELCRLHQVWLHVDGAYGGAALASPLTRELFRGIERADSFIVDPHKWLFAPYDCCAVLYRDGDTARAAHSQRASYLDQVDREILNPTDLGLHLSRRSRGLPFWFSLATYGTRRYREAVERTVLTAREVAAHIAATPHLRLIMEPEFSVVLFERIGWDEAQYRQWSARTAHDGVILCLPTRWQGRTVLRLAFVNPDTRADAVIEALRTLGDGSGGVSSP